jgi:hypothetical protein
MFVEGDSNSAWNRRYHDLVVRHVEDLGGYDLMSEAQLSMIRRAAAIECELERLDGLLSNGIEINLDMYSRCAGHLRRMFETLGIERLDRLKAVTARSPLRQRLERQAQRRVAEDAMTIEAAAVS